MISLGTKSLRTQLQPRGLYPSIISGIGIHWRLTCCHSCHVSNRKQFWYAYEWSRTALGSEDSCTLTSQHELAGAYQANGQIKQAVELLEYVVKIRERVLAEDHLSRLASQHELARAYQADGQIKQA